MARLSAKLRSVGGVGYEGIGFWCPACHGIHVVRTGPNGWTWDGNVDAPTISPSIKVTEHTGAVCHSFVRSGNIEFCADTTHIIDGKLTSHPLAGKDLADFREYGGV